jgi:gluconokinase
LLDSQLASLEPLQPDEAGIVLDISNDVGELVRQILQVKIDMPQTGQP